MQPNLETTICDLLDQELSTPLPSLSINFCNPRGLPAPPAAGTQVQSVVTFVPPLIWEVSSPGEVELSAVQATAYSKKKKTTLTEGKIKSCLKLLLPSTATRSLTWITGPLPLGWNKIQTP